MKRLNLIYLFLSLALLAPSLTGCSDDFDLDDNREHQIKTGIVLKIPNIRSMASRAQTRADDPLTRAEANAIADEGGIQADGESRDFWVFIYKTDGTPVEPIQLNAPSSLPSLDDSGKPKYYGYNNGTNTYYEISLDPTSYRVYLVANLSEYVPETNWSNISEDNLKGLIMNLGSVISSNKANTILQPGHLPMVCMPTDIDGADPDTGEINVASADVKELKANLVFQCAKIRYTILFDNIPDANGNGFSNEGFGNHLLDFTGATIRNVAAQTCVDDTKATPDFYLPASGSSFTAALKPVEYPKDGADYVKPNPNQNPSVSGDRVSDLAPRGDWTATEKKRAWQGVIYVPENKSTTTKTTMTFAGVIDPKSDGTGVNNSYTINLIGPSGNSSTVTSVDPADGTAMGSSSHVTIDRGTFYDLTLLAKKMNAFDINFTVKDWTTEQLVYDLHGPYYLHVDQTKIGLTTGETKRIKYEANTDISFESPTFLAKDGKRYPVYDITTEGDEIVVSISSAVKSTYFEEIAGDATKMKYNFFHVVAGPIKKKIEVDPFSLGLFLTVDPDEITINVREQVGSGIYYGTYPITIKTNYEHYKISKENWSADVAGLIYLTDKDGNAVSFDTEINTPDNGQVDLLLHYTGLNSGKEFWTKDPHSMGLKVDAYNSESVKASDNVVIKTMPSTDDYIIHLYAPDWGSAHCYVYQCLELPADFTPKDDSNNHSYASEPIGYKDNNNWFAALEYSFTGKIAFKGWESEYNKKALVTTTKTTLGNKASNSGFYTLDNGGNGNWNPSSDNGSHYDLDFDLSKDFRDNDSHCQSCKSSNYFKYWPGIGMKKETDASGNWTGWWMYRLSGVATPGKALIMFSNNHANSSNQRYPAENEAGYPLFDYPSREGWFYPTDLAFSSTSPSPRPTSGNHTFRICWYYEYDGKHRSKIEIENGPHAETYDKTGVSAGDSNEYYYEFSMDLSQFPPDGLKYHTEGDADSKPFIKLKEDFYWDGHRFYVNKEDP